MPVLEDFLYYYELDVAGLSKFDFSLFTLFRFVYIIVSIILFNLLFIKTESRLVTLSAIFMGTLGCGFTINFVTGNTADMNNQIIYIICLMSSFNTLFYNWFSLPGWILYPKLIPANVETSMFALTSGVNYLSYYFVGKNLGSLINVLFF